MQIAAAGFLPLDGDLMPLGFVAPVAGTRWDFRTWREVAASLGRTEAAVRQQWSRCLKDLRKAAAESEGLLRAWAELSARP